MQLTFQLTRVEFIYISVENVLWLTTELHNFETSCPLTVTITAFLWQLGFRKSTYVTRRVHTGNEHTKLTSTAFSLDYTCGR
jgi:hypothetical protein